jgi:hypothetical protein
MKGAASCQRKVEMSGFSQDRSASASGFCRHMVFGFDAVLGFCFDPQVPEAVGRKDLRIVAGCWAIAQNIAAANHFLEYGGSGTSGLDHK